MVWEELVHDPSKRRLQAQNKPGPWSYGDFTEVAIDDALRRITENATEQTRPLFQSGPDSQGDPYWPARWILYHIFRNRDSRNRSRNRITRASSSATQNQSEDFHSWFPPLSPPPSPFWFKPGFPHQPFLITIPSTNFFVDDLLLDRSRGQVYDPVRDR